MKEDIDKCDKKNAEWDFIRMLLILLVAFLFQSIAVPCLCAAGVGKMKFAIIIDLLILIRIIYAKLRHEKGRGWIFYAVLLLTSPIWINLLSWVVTGH